MRHFLNILLDYFKTNRLDENLNATFNRLAIAQFSTNAAIILYSIDICVIRCYKKHLIIKRSYQVSKITQSRHYVGYIQHDLT